MVTIYKRRDGRIYLHAYQKSSMGINLAGPPFIKIEPSDILEMPEAIKKLLAIEPATVPHPKAFDQLEPLYSIAECKDWKEFAKGTLCLHVGVEDGIVRVTRTKKDGAGFSDLPEPISLGAVTGLASILSAVPELKRA
jgi:hypothetical protein